MDLTQEIELVQIKGKESQIKKDQIVKEHHIAIEVNEKKLTNLTCTPNHLKELATGYLYSEKKFKNVRNIETIERCKNTIKVIISPDKLNSINLNEEKITDACKRDTKELNLAETDLCEIESDIKILNNKIREMIVELQNNSKLFKKTGAVHNALLTDKKQNKLIFREDIGRHNVIDKIIGKMILDQISPKNKILVISGRISSSILIKTAKIKIPIIVSMSAPTDLAIKIASILDITLIGFVRGKKMNIYSNEKRIQY